ncbi:carboxypeptidase-like regulatory domain-containing protein [Wenyingzhuangia sp. chi5]|uniref:Carboxypeptidase-like regulatory domain-containing protein n=1 Tax=Wenyingzhuangia gilva TaxID=3057677 RepID=A0ABT8VT23_9FLAO|nr:carboxypeptidase-like regulatory domain-containing protein [Wenyingzhuangia sp. chi5]MDO3695111.1 carboxypeptidase-like regulatory domain-containing protein [Wenyingzhuangia sp. chi5]
MKTILSLFVFLYTTLLFSQTGFVAGTITNENKEPLSGVNITYHQKGVVSDENGAYKIEIPANEQTLVKFSYLGYGSVFKTFKGYKNKTIKYSPVLKIESQEMEEVNLKSYQAAQEGIVKLKAKKFKRIPGANAGIENLLMTQPGVNNSNELSTQYSVRGGSFDENLVYVNGIEIYRPFLIRSGQQEGLSFLNSDMTENINFSAGGFEAKYGDRLSSVLNIHYKKPTKELSTVNLNLLGASYTYENLFLNKKLSTLIGARYRNNQLLVSSKDTKTNFKPVFADIQTYLSYKINNKSSVDFLGNIAMNNYNFTPISRVTKFGGLFQPRELVVFYEGNEQDDFNTYFGALSYKYDFTKNTKLDITGSAFNTQEQEYYDIYGAYSIAEVNPTSGNPLYTSGVGTQLDHARNDLDILIQNVKVSLQHKINEHHFEIGTKFQSENIRDRVNEWKAIDDNGLTLRNPNLNTVNNQPFDPFTAPIDLYYKVKAQNDVNINRFSGYFQWNKKWYLGDHILWHHAGIRSQFWNIKNNKTQTTSSFQNTISPRFRLSLKPDWQHTDMVFRLSAGYYHQPPSYKELRDVNGDIQSDLKAQESIHYVFANEYSFTLWERPFKMTSEVYYKKLNDVNAYSLDNVRVRYDANNNTKAYATGLDLRLSGEFVPGKESWVSFGLLKTQENTNNRGYIARPTDQRFKLAILFQDYVPSNPNFKVFLNLVLNSSLPGGAPINARADNSTTVDRYNFQTRLRPYRRADLGASYIIVDQNKQYTSGFLSRFKELELGIELFNMFDIQNTTTNTWIYDVDSQRYNSVPNILTGRILNFKVGMQF